jgi:hypothetical protein
MEILLLLEQIPPTFLGIVIGSIFTIIGVALSNASNTQRLRLQHEHERSMDHRKQDLSLRRETYLAAMEAISAGMVAVGRFSDLATSDQALMQSYTDRSPAISKVAVVGNEETIKAVANFGQELIGAFLRLTSEREKIGLLWKRSESLERDIQHASQEQDRLLALIQHSQTGQSPGEPQPVLQQQYEAERQRMESLQAEQAEAGEQLLASQMELVKTCVREMQMLDELLIPVISLMRAELELPFNRDFYAQIIADGHKNQAEFIEHFLREQTAEAQ